MSVNSFGRQNRLTNTFEFKRVREKGAFFRDKTFAIAVLKNDDGNHRLGLSISKSVVKRASKRNKLKRIVRETFRTSKGRMKYGPYDIVFYVKRTLSDDFDYNTVRRGLLALMAKAKILC